MVKKFLISTLVASILTNIIFTFFFIKKINWENHLRRFENQIVAQPKTIHYFTARDQLFIHLPKDTDEIIMLGTSLTQNYEWHETFKNINIKNRGIIGDITKGILFRLDEVLKSKPQKIFIEAGVNDILLGYPIDSIFNNYKNIIMRIKKISPSTAIYIQSLIPTNTVIKNTNKSTNPIIRELNQQLVNYCTTNNITYIDLFSRFSFNDSLNENYECGDKIHLNGKGYEIWCETIKHYIN